MSIELLLGVALGYIPCEFEISHSSFPFADFDFQKRC